MLKLSISLTASFLTFGYIIFLVPIYFSINGNIESGPIKVTLTGDDALRSQYVPTEPAVKILKRPMKENQLSTDIKKPVPKKTLQQREQEYAEARLRILGEASSEKAEER